MKRVVAAAALAAGLALASGAQAVDLPTAKGEVDGTFLGLHCYAFTFVGDPTIRGFPRVSAGTPINPDVPAGTPINSDAVGVIDNAYQAHFQLMLLKASGKVIPPAQQAALQAAAEISVVEVGEVAPYCSAIPVDVDLIQGVRKGSLRG